MSRVSIMTLVFIVFGAATASAGQTVGLFQNDPGSFDGYTLFNSLQSRTTYLIDNWGRQVRSWEGSHVIGNSAYLLESGHLLRTADPGGNGVFTGGGDAGLIEEYDWDGTLLWTYLYSNNQHRHHHDVAPLPNGNVLIVAWELKTMQQAIDAGRNPALLTSGELWPEHIVEIQPTLPVGGFIVWEWHVWDHLIQDFDPTKGNFGVVADHPELIDINFAPNTGADWQHANAIDYNAGLDQILINSPYLNEFWVIDHSTTTAESASHAGGNRGRGGDLLYRWGNPQAYDAGAPAEQTLFGQHNAHWIAPELPGEGNVLVFNNGVGRPQGAYSTIDEVTTTVDANGDYPLPAAGVPHGPAAADIVYIADPPNSFYASFISGAQRQPNGNTLICDGPRGRFFEITSEQDQVWLYVNPVNAGGPLDQGDPPVGTATFRAERYGPDFAGFDGRDLTPGGPIEGGTTAIADAQSVPRGLRLHGSYPNPFHPTTQIAFSLEQSSSVRLVIYNVVGRQVATLLDGRVLAPGAHRVRWTAVDLPNGVYRYALAVGDQLETGSMLLVR